MITSKRFGPLFWTQFFGAFNDNFLKNALVIAITYKGVHVFGIPPEQMVALSGGIFILPYFLFSATAGQLADQQEKSKIIRAIKVIEIIIMLLATLGFLTQWYGFLLLVLFLMGLHSTFFGPIKYSILPQHLPPEELVKGNALIEAGTFLAILLGTVAGGALIVLESGDFIVSIGLLLVALWGWISSRLIPLAPAVDPGLKVQWNPVRPTIAIHREMKKNRPVFLSILGISWFWFFGAVLLSIFPTYCKDVLHAKPSVVTLFLSFFSIGIALGSLLCEKLSRKQLELGLVPLGSIGMTFFAIELARNGVPDFTLGATNLGIPDFFRDTQGLRLMFDLLALSIVIGLYIVPLYTLIQERADPKLRSRTIAGNNIINACFMVGAAVFLMILFRIGCTIPQIFMILAISNLLVAGYIYFLLPEFLFRLCALFLARVMYRLKVTGEEHLPQKGPALFIANHVTYVDWILISAVVRTPIRFIMDHAFAKGWIGKAFARQAKIIIIASQKENPELMERAFQQAERELKDGAFVFIFPEGQLTRDGKMSPFRPGVEKILQQTPVPVIPMALVGLWGSFFSRERGVAVLKTPKRFWSKVELRIGEALPPTASAAEMQQAVTRLFSRK